MEPLGPLPEIPEDQLTDEQLSAREAQKLDVERNRTVAAVSYIYILSLVALYARKDSRFTQFHARQGTALFCAALICLAFPVWWIQIPLEFVLFMVMAYGFVQASQGRWTRIPLVADLLERRRESRVAKVADSAFVALTDTVKKVTRPGENGERRVESGSPSPSTEPQAAGPTPQPPEPQAAGPTPQPPPVIPPAA